MYFYMKFALLAGLVSAQGNDGYLTKISVDNFGTTTISYVPITTIISAEPSVPATLFPVPQTLPIVSVSTIVTLTSTVPLVIFPTSIAPTITLATRARETSSISSPIVVEPPSVPPPTPARGYQAQNPPAIGLGTWQLTAQRGGRSVSDVVAGAIENGYRHIDCAYIYSNQVEVGAGIREGLRRTNLTREDLWITGKLWNSRHGNEEAGLRETLSQMGLDYLDLFLVHWPLGNSTGGTTFDYINVWRGMERLVGRRDYGTRFIGISNFSPSQVQDLLSIATIRPKVHQIELHPYLPQTEFIETHNRLGISVTGYSPLANTNPVYGSRGSAAPPLLDNVILKEIGNARGCTAAQVALAWNLRRGVVVIPKSANDVRQKENIDTFNRCFLTDGDMAKLAQIGIKTRFNVSTCKSLGYGCFAGLEVSNP